MDLRHLDTKNNTIIIGGKYLLQERLGGGSFGQLYAAINNVNKAPLAIKLEQFIPNKNATLSREAKVISDLEDEAGFPVFYSYGKEDKFSFLAMSLLGPNMEKLLKVCGHKFSLKTVLMLADQMLTRIEVLHKKDYIHRDIKPENFCIGMSQERQILYIIDFGLTRSYKDSNGQHIPFKEKKGLVGTARYASINTHLGIEQSRRDDLESIGYTLIYFLKGELPWQNIKTQDKQEKYRLIAETKINTPTEILCKDLPEEFKLYLDYVRGLGFTDTPNYKYLKRLFRTLFIKKQYILDYNYDWMGIQNAIGDSPIYKLENTHNDKLFKAKGIKKKIDQDETPKDNKSPFFKSPQAINLKTPISGPFSHRCWVNPSSKQEFNNIESKINNQDQILLKSKMNIKFRNTPGTELRKVIPETSYKNGSTSSGDSSKGLNLSDSQAIIAPSELTPKDYPSAKIEQIKIFNVKNKDFGYESRNFFASACIFEGVGPKTRQFLTHRNYPTFSNTHLYNDLQADANNNTSKQVAKNNAIFEIEEDMADTSICEWKEGNSLGNMMQNKKFCV